MMEGNKTSSTDCDNCQHRDPDRYCNDARSCRGNHNAVGHSHTSHFCKRSGAGSSIAAANSRAVDLLHRGLNTRAVQCLEGALRHLHKIAAATLVNLDGDSEGEPDRAADDAAARGRVRIRASDRMCRSWDESGGGIFAWYARPVLLWGADDEDDDRQLLRSGSDQNRAAAVLLFNLSLAYRGVGGGHDEKAVKCARKMSEMAGHLIERVVPQSVGDIHLRVSILNNLGFLQLWFSDHDEANHSLLKLETSLASDLPQFDASLADDETEAYREITDAVCTLVLFQGKTVLPTAPAA